MAMAEKKLTGKIARERIRLMEAPRPPGDLIEGYLGLGQASGILSDIMDELGITGVIAASVLKPTMPGACIAGPALTVRNMIQREHAYETARRHVNKMAEFEAHNLALPGDVIVIDGVPGISNMGGISAQTGKRQGEAGAIVFGGVRDIAHSRAVGYPVWSTEVTPVTGQMAHRDCRDQRRDRSRGCARSAGRHRVRRRQRRVLHSPRARRGSAGSALARRRRPRKPSARRSTLARLCRICPGTRDQKHEPLAGSAWAVGRPAR